MKHLLLIFTASAVCTNSHKEAYKTSTHKASRTRKIVLGTTGIAIVTGTVIVYKKYFTSSRSEDATAHTPTADRTPSSGSEDATAQTSTAIGAYDLTSEESYKVRKYVYNEVYKQALAAVAHKYPSVDNNLLNAVVAQHVYSELFKIYEYGDTFYIPSLYSGKVEWLYLNYTEFETLLKEIKTDYTTKQIMDAKNALHKHVLTLDSIPIILDKGETTTTTSMGTHRGGALVNSILKEVSPDSILKQCSTATDTWKNSFIPTRVKSSLEQHPILLHLVHAIGDYRVGARNGLLFKATRT